MTAPPDPAAAPPLPTIDVSPFLSLDTATSPAAAACAAAVRAAFTPPGGAGFFYATGHGIPPDATDAVFAALAAFFSAPQAVKDSLAAANNPLYRGYVGAGSLAHSCAPGADDAGGKATAGELKESMTVGMEAPAPPGTASPMHGPNQWPPPGAVPGFEGAVRGYLAAGLRASRAVARATAAALGQPPHWFDAALTDPVAQLVLLRYPGVEGGGVGGAAAAAAAGEREGAPPAPGCGAHTDCGLITLVAQRGPPGLQVARPGEGGEGGGGAPGGAHWVTAPPGPGTLVVNFGDLAAFWSGRAIASTLHRVLSPPAGGPARDSVILFANARFDAEVVAGGAAVVGGGAGAGAAADAKRTTAGLYMLDKLGLMWLADKEAKQAEGA